MITNAVIQQPAVVNAALRHNANMDEEEKKKCESHSVPNDTIPDKTTTTTEKGIATAMIPAGRHCNDSRNSSDGDSFESLFNGSTYYIDEYFNSIGFDGGSSMSSGTGSSYGGQQHHLHHHTIPMECRSIISGISGDDGDDVYYDSQSDHHRNHHPNSHMSNTNSDVASVDTSPSLSSSASSTLNGLIISNDASSSSSSTSSLSMSAAVLSPHHHKSAVNAVVTNVDASLTPVTKPKLPETTKSSSFRVKMLLLLEKIIVTSLLLAIAASCTITILAIVRHLHYDPNTNPGTAARGIVTSYNHTTTTTTSSGNSTASGDERWSHIRNIVRDRYGESAFDPIPGTPQHDALVWMAYVDVPSILGHDLQLRSIASETNDTNETEAALVWNTNLSIRITQRYVLLVLFFHNIGTEHLMLGGWASLTGARLTECIWPGITCRRKVTTATEPNTQLSVVTGLELNPWIAHLHGSIPTEIGFLPHLGASLFLDLLAVAIFFSRSVSPTFFLLHRYVFRVPGLHR